MRLCDLTIGALSPVLTGSCCKAAIQFGHHAAPSYRRVRSLKAPIPLHETDRCNVPNYNRSASTCYRNSSLASLPLTARRLSSLRTIPRMQISNYLRQASLYRRSHVTDQFFESKVDALFQHVGGKSVIEVYHQPPPKLPTPPVVLNDKQNSDCSPAHASFLDQSRHKSSDADPPPIYDRSPGLVRQDIVDLEDVQRIEKVSASLIAWSARSNTHRNKGDKTPFPYMVSESLKPSSTVPF